MTNHVQDPPVQEKNSTGKGTGFPEPLSEDRNTTLPHPDADTSPNATIEAPDACMPRAHSRRSFLHHAKHHSQRSSFTQQDLERSGLYDNIEYADGSRVDKALVTTEGDAEKKDDLLKPAYSNGSSTLDGSFEREDGERKRALLKRMGF